MFGGSATSLSPTSAANTVKVQALVIGRSPAGSIVTLVVVAGKVTGLITVKPIGDPLGHSNENVAAEPMSTGSLKLTTRLLLTATLLAPLAGVVVVTAGAASTLKATTKSAARLFGGSIRSSSLMADAKTVNTQESPGEKSTAGFSVYTGSASVTPRPDETSRMPEIEQETCAQLPVVVTGSLKISRMSVLASVDWPGPGGNAVKTPPISASAVLIAGAASTLIAIRSVSDCGPPLPVLPLSLVATVIVPLPPAPLEKLSVCSVALTSATMSVIDTLLLPLPVTMAPFCAVAVKLPSVVETVVVTVPAAASRSATLMLFGPVNASGTPTPVDSGPAGTVLTGASLTAVTLMTKVCGAEVSTPPFAVPPLSCRVNVIVAVPLAFAAGV